jgi:hypothetical protein
MVEFSEIYFRALSESVFSVLQEGRQGNKGLSGFPLLHRNHENGLMTQVDDLKVTCKKPRS